MTQPCVSDLDRKRALAAIRAWYAPYRPPELEPGDIEDMLAALAAPTAEIALVVWAYRAVPRDYLDPSEVQAMTDARSAAAEVSA